MDDPVQDPGADKGTPLMAFKLAVALFFQITVIFCLALVLGFIGFLAILFGRASFSYSVYLPSQCRIVSSGVDIRSSKVCGIELLNYGGKHVFHPFESSKFHCRYDYYWASIFKVEYTDHVSGQILFGLAEAPNEALPPECRPSFLAAWLTKDKFKVNESYECWYTTGISRVQLRQEGLFSCKAKNLSKTEMVRRYFTLLTAVIQSCFGSVGRAKYWRWETIAGVITGFSTSLFSIRLVGILHRMRSWSPLMHGVKTLVWPVSRARFLGVCISVAYFSVTGWLAIHYVKRLGLPKIDVND